MDSIETVQENIEIGVDATTVKIPLRVSMSVVDNAPFEFTSSIDEAGNIVLTPNSSDAQFDSVKMQKDFPEDIDITALDSVESSEGSTASKETTIIIDANMLHETDTLEYTVDIDAIGQCVISPADDENMFVSASIEDSLNLTTEEESAPEVLEDIQETEQETVEDQPEVTAEVIEDTEVNIVESLTEQYTEVSGSIMCDTHEELARCLDSLLDHYIHVKVTKVNNRYIISYEKDLIEESYDDNSEVIDKFMRGELALFIADNKSVCDNLKHIVDLDTEDYAYYYDEENGSMVTCKKDIA